MWFHVNMTQFIYLMGYLGIFFIIFAETGLFMGFFLPGDSLLLTAGFLASQGFFQINLLIFDVIIAAIMGYAIAYWIGQYLGEWLLKKEDRFWFKKTYLNQAQDFYTKHGGKTLIIGRLLPIIRTFVPIVAGMSKMSYRRYAFYNIIGGIFWAGGFCLLGFYLGGIIPNANHYITLVILFIALISLLPALKPIITAYLARRNKFI